MIPRYADPRIDDLFTDPAKVLRWQGVELAVIKARCNLGMLPSKVHASIAAALEANPCDIPWWLEREQTTQHDLVAFIDERLRFIPIELQAHFHEHMTSYDTEDAAFSRALLDASAYVSADLAAFISLLRELADRYRYVVMLERTHGQGAKLRSFGGRVLTWLAPLLETQKRLDEAAESCRYSRISGAVGNYGGGLTPEIEREALTILGLVPFYGATQILPRIVHAPLVHTLRSVAEVLGQIALDFRLGARSGKPLWHEPFGKGQKGSSAMPHKKNTIKTEQMEGMLALVRGTAETIMQSVQTWEGRAINQSCVERVAWLNLFHEVLRMISVMHNVLVGMVVYPDHMMQEIQNSCGTYASDEAKNFLADQCGKSGVEFETAYRILQLASWNVLSPTLYWMTVRENPAVSPEDADSLILKFMPERDSMASIRDVIADARLATHPELDATAEQVDDWNKLLQQIFEGAAVRTEWEQLFKPSFLLRSEGYLFDQVLAA